MNKQTINKRRPYIIMALVVALACMGLGLLDHETRALTDLFKGGNIFGILLYFVPTFLCCAMLYRFLRLRTGRHESVIYSLLVGVPLGLIGVVAVLLSLKN